MHIANIFFRQRAPSERILSLLFPVSHPWDRGRVDDMDKVKRLLHAERTEIDGRRVHALVREMGHTSAERLFGRALDEIDERMRAADRAAARGDMRATARSARQLVAVANAVGLTSIARVAKMVMDTAEAGDGAALAATLARLSRLMDGAVRAIGEAWAASL
jgi:hypothetical protein